METSHTFSSSHPKQRRITRADILSLDEYGKIRRQQRAKLVEEKRTRRTHIGPHITLYFENFETMWSQIQEMLYIERGGEDQIEGELSAYNALIPQGTELVETMMIEIEDESIRRKTLSILGHIENMLTIQFSNHTINSIPEDDIERTTADGKTSAVHFLRFPFTPEQIATFRDPSVEVTVGIHHPNYGHTAMLPKDMQATLAKDFA